ncbi:unnamed protein product [Sphacelaria rigidula]
MWLSNNTHPDIADAVKTALRHHESLTPEDWRRVLRMFEYLNSTVDFVITYVRHSSKELWAFADIDYENFNDGRSVPGRAIFYCGAVVGIFSRTKKIHLCLQRRQNM